MKRFLAAPTSEEKDDNKRRCLVNYNKEWEREFPWVTSSMKNGNIAFCTSCHANLSIGHGGRDDLRKHAVTKKHLDAQKSIKQAGTMTSFLKKGAGSSALDEDVIRAEAVFVRTLAQTNSSFASADTWIQSIKEMFPTSEVAKRLKCCRSKATALTKEIAKISQKHLVAALKSGPFTVSTDGSNDWGSLKQFPLIVRCVAGDGVNSYVLSVPCLEGSATGENIFGLIQSAFDSVGLTWDNCIAVGSDNANVMVGDKNGVFGHVQSKNDKVYLAGCCCHLIHIAAKKAAAKLPVNVEEILVDSFYYLEGSSLRKAQFKELQLHHEVKQNKILKHVATRWLSLKSCLPRLLDNWEPLLEMARVDIKKKGSSCKTERLTRIKTFLKSHTNKAYVMFLKDALSPFDDFNVSLQTDEPKIHLLQRKLLKLLKQLMIRILKPFALANKPILEVDYENVACHQTNDQMILSDEVKEVLATLKPDSQLTFYSSVRAFYVAAISYIKSKLPVNDPVLRAAEIADMDVGDRSESLDFMLDRFPCLQPKGVSKSTIKLEYANYLALQKEELPSEGRMDSRWQALKQLKDEEGCPVFNHLPALMQHILTIPHSSAHCERIFSLVKNIKTDQRSCLSSESLEALLILKSCDFPTITTETAQSLKSAYCRSLRESQ